MKILNRVGIVFILLLIVCPIVYADSVDASSHYEKGVSFLKEEQYDLAIDAFQHALQDEKGAAAQSRIYNLIGLAYMKQGVSVSSAIGSFEQAIKLDPKYAEAYFNIASAYSEKNANPLKAVEYFKKTIEVDPRYTKAYFGLGWFTLMQEDNPGQAIEYFQKTLDNYPDFAEALYGKGLAYIRVHKPYMALGMVSQLRSIKRDDLAAGLEKSITEVSPPQETVAVVSKQPAAENNAPAADASAPKPQKKSPFQVMMRGKVVPVKEDAK